MLAENGAPARMGGRCKKGGKAHCAHRPDGCYRAVGLHAVGVGTTGDQVLECIGLDQLDVLVVHAQPALLLELGQRTADGFQFQAEEAADFLAALQAQLQLSRHPLARRVLPPDFVACASQARLAGWFFYSRSSRPMPPLAADQLQGWFSPLLQPWPSSSPASRWMWLPRLSWLAPARVAEAEVREQHSLRQELRQAVVPQLVAELLPLGDGYWEEVARGFVVPPGWPEATRLQALMATLPGSPAA